MKNLKSIFLLSIIFLTLIACKKEKVEVPQPIINQPENITTFKLQFTDSSNISSVFSAQYRDLDGPGGNSAIIDSLILGKNKTYFLSLVLLDETKVPVLEISKEILEEGVDHQFFISSTNAGILFKYDDKDLNGNPIGLKFIVRTGNANSLGKTKVVLKHQPGIKVAAPGDITKGETDAEVEFNSRIK